MEWLNIRVFICLKHLRTFFAVLDVEVRILALELHRLFEWQRYFLWIFEPNVVFVNDILNVLLVLLLSLDLVFVEGHFEII